MMLEFNFSSCFKYTLEFTNSFSFFSLIILSVGFLFGHAACCRDLIYKLLLGVPTFVGTLDTVGLIQWAWYSGLVCQRNYVRSWTSKHTPRDYTLCHKIKPGCDATVVNHIKRGSSSRHLRWLAKVNNNKIVLLKHDNVLSAIMYRFVHGLGVWWNENPWRMIWCLTNICDWICKKAPFSHTKFDPFFKPWSFITFLLLHIITWNFPWEQLATFWD